MTTVAEWMAKVQENRDLLLGVIKAFHPATNKLGSFGYPITAALAEAVSGPIRDEARRATPNPLGEFADGLKNASYATVCKVMSEAWFGAPESREVYRVPGFSLLSSMLDDPPDLTPEEETMLEPTGSI